MSGNEAARCVALKERLDECLRLNPSAFPATALWILGVWMTRFAGYYLGVGYQFLGV